ncbi:hypothetical protein L218DRAFT_762791 [Marasmius fiardii PR-910]|nr:hypothetical protein L218DRAFT_762791 [Marasmius fiardii PR-910]
MFCLCSVFMSWLSRTSLIRRNHRPAVPFLPGLEEHFNPTFVPPPPLELAQENRKALDGEKAIARPQRRRIPALEDNCPICHETMYDPIKPTVEDLKDSLEWCTQCGNAAHTECWNRYTLYIKEEADTELTCSWCRAPWTVNAPNHSRLAEEGSSRSPSGLYSIPVALQMPFIPSPEIL